MPQRRGQYFMAASRSPASNGGAGLEGLSVVYSTDRISQEQSHHLGIVATDKRGSEQIVVPAPAEACSPK